MTSSISECLKRHPVTAASGRCNLNAAASRAVRCSEQLLHRIWHCSSFVCWPDTLLGLRLTPWLLERLKAGQQCSAQCYKPCPAYVWSCAVFSRPGQGTGNVLKCASLTACQGCVCTNIGVQMRLLKDNGYGFRLYVYAHLHIPSTHSPLTHIHHQLQCPTRSPYP